jgi:hypothetical protein
VNPAFEKVLDAMNTGLLDIGIQANYQAMELSEVID